MNIYIYIYIDIYICICHNRHCNLVENIIMMMLVIITSTKTKVFASIQMLFYKMQHIGTAQCNHHGLPLVHIISSALLHKY